MRIDERLDLVPADANLPDVVNSLYAMRRREEVLARQLSDELDVYDVVLIDMPPGQDLLAVNGLVLATHVVVPVRMTDANAVNGLIDLQDFLAELAELEWHRPIALVLRIDCKPLTNNFKALNEALLSMDLNVSEHITRHTTLVEQSVTTGQTIVTWQPYSAPGLAYMKFAGELDELLLGVAPDGPEGDLQRAQGSAPAPPAYDRQPAPRHLPCGARRGRRQATDQHPGTQARPGRRAFARRVACRR